MTASQLTLYSLGIAAENLTIGQRTLQVTPIEHLNFVDGELKSNPTNDTVTGQDADGNSTQTKVITDNSLEATWLPFHSNRHTAPNIRRGERVLLWRFANQDKYYWTELGLDHKYRKLETVTYVFNATQNESDDTTNFENCYYVEVSTHKGTITLKTSKANKEKTAHTVQFNPMAGTFTFADDLGQVIFVDSVKHVIHLANADQSQITLDKQIITVQCQDTLNLISAKTMNLQTQTLNVKATNINITCDQTIQAQAANVTANVSGTVNVQAPTIKLGQVTIDSSGKITCNGIQSGAAIQTAGLNSSLPISAPNI